MIARKAHVRVVLQCKLWSGPAGTSAVQQAYAARAYHGASHAAVVATAGFTPGAKNLARTTGVHLLSPQHLSRADRLFGVPEAQQKPERPPAPRAPPGRALRRCSWCRVPMSLPRWRAGHVTCPRCGRRDWYLTLWA